MMAEACTGLKECTTGGYVAAIGSSFTGRCTWRMSCLSALGEGRCRISCLIKAILAASWGWIFLLLASLGSAEQRIQTDIKADILVAPGDAKLSKRLWMR